MPKKNDIPSGERSNNADLHVHTFFSDGIFSPNEVVQKALELGLKAVSITDHDCVDGISLAIECATGTNLEVIPGIEMSAFKDDVEIHILGYFINWQDSKLLKFLEELRNNREKRIKNMIRIVNENLGNISEYDVFGYGSGSIGRLHLARAMVSSGMVRDIKEAFDSYIGNGKPCYLSHKRLDYKDAIAFIIEAGGVPVLAHPGTMGKDEYIMDYVRAGLRGIEVYHTKHKPYLNNRYYFMAHEYGLLITGGSDCHGMEHKYGLLMGKINVDYSIVELLRNESEKIRAKNSNRD